MGHDQLIVTCIPVFCCVMPAVLLILFIPNLAFLIPSFTIARSNLNNTCDGSTIGLSNWLIVDASVKAALCAAVLILLVIFLQQYCLESLKRTGPALFTVILIISILYFLFVLAWNIVGCVALFRDSPKCDNQPIGKMTLAALIFQWITIVFNWFFLPFVAYLVVNILE